MSSHAHNSFAENGYDGHHCASYKELRSTIAQLAVLMVVTIAAAEAPHYMNFSVPFWLANLIALAIAFTKAQRVISVFMGVKYTTKIVKIYAIGGFVFSILLGMILVDYIARPQEVVKGWEAAPSSAMSRNPDMPDGLDQEVKLPGRIRPEPGGTMHLQFAPGGHEEEGEGGH